jgi:hypothetical protein
MAVDSLHTPGAFRVGDVISRAWRLFTGNILFFVAVPFVSYVIVFIATVVFTLTLAFVGWASNMTAVAIVRFILGFLMFIGLYMIGEAVVLLGAFQRLRGQPLQVGEALNRAFAQFFPLIGLSILWGLGIMIGMMLLIVPGFILLCMWAVVVPACIVEGLGVTASISRSSDLTRGYRWPILGLLLLLGIINWIGSKVIQLILGMASSTLASIASFIWLAGWTGYWNCVLIMTYHDLRVAKEGVDTEQIASIFD